MPFQPSQPLEIDDFSGGITENYLQSDPRRHQTIDNFLITTDKKLRMRPAIVALDSTNYVLPNSLSQRISGMYYWMSESQLFAQSGRKLFALDQTPSWVEMSGLNSKDAISGGDERSQTTYAEFQRQVYLTSDGVDGLGVMPSKIYQDTTNTWRAKTAGLPRSWVPGTYTAASLLATCIYNANALRTSMLSHFQDAKFPTYTAANLGQSPGLSLHMNIDKYSLSYLQSTTFTIVDPETPSPVPTPAPAATSQATLFTLVGALNSAFTHHVTEASSGSSLPISSTYQQNSVVYHMRPGVYNYANSITRPPAGPYAMPLANATPTTVAQAASMLDDLLQKWNWHRSAVWTHSPTNDPQSFFYKYIPQCTAIGTVTTGNSTPVVTPDYTDIINYANNLKFVYNAHVSQNVSGGTAAHGQDSGSSANGANYNLNLFCGLNDATDLNSSYLLIYWLRALYSLHYADANQAVHLGVTFTTAAGSASVTAVTNTATAAAITLTVGSFVSMGFGQGVIFGDGSLTAKVTASGSGTATFDKLASGTLAGTLGQQSTSLFHVSVNSSLVLTNSTVSVEQATDALSASVVSLGTDTNSWLILASDLFYALMSHMNFATVHIASYSPTVTPLVYLAATASPFYIPTVSEFSYAFFFSDDYTVGANGIEYLVRGNPTISAVTQSAVTYPVNYTIPTATAAVYPSIVNTFTRSNVITGLPVLTNALNTNYDTSNALLNIYRTTNGGQTYYLLAQVANGTASYTDSTHDSLSQANGTPALLNLNQTMYTTGGTVGADQPPISKFIHILSGTTYYGGITDGGQYFPQQIRQSVQFAPDWCPATFSDNLDDELTGISSTKSNIMAFCKNSTYRMSGGFSQTGQGALTHDRITDSIGSLNAKGIVKTEVGVFFPGNDGFYYTDGYQVIKISLELTKTYLSLTKSDSQKRSIEGTYDKATRRIWWAMQKTDSDTDNSIVYVYYLDFGIKPSGVFTTVSNFTNFKPSAMVFNAGTLYMGSGDGYILKSDEHQKADFQIAGLSVSGTSASQYIPWELTTGALDIGTISRRKYMTKMRLVGKNSGNVAAQIYALKDLNQTGIGPQGFAPVSYNQNVMWGNPLCVWNDSTQVWKTDGKMDLWRRFPKQSLRSDFMQLSFKPSYQVVYASEMNNPAGAYATVALNVNVPPVVNVVTLLTPSGYTALVWPSDVVGYDIKFSFDNYATSYAITYLSGAVIRVLDPNATLTQLLTGGYKWEIWGYKKQQRPTITALAITYAENESPTESFPGSNSNQGSGNTGQNP